MIKDFIKKILPLFILHKPDFFLPSSNLKKFRNIHSDDIAVIIGNGPSLNKIDFKILTNYISFGVNGIFYKKDELGFTPDYYVVEDTAVMKDNVERIKNFNGLKANFFPKMYKKYFLDHSNNYYFSMDRRFYEKSSYSFEIPQFSLDINNRIFCNQSVTFINLQIAYYMGFKKVLLVGMDNNYEVPNSSIIDEHKILSQDDDPNHFHPDYFGKGKTWHDPKLYNVKKAYKFFKLIYESDNREIINCSIGGKLEIFRRGKLEDYL